MSSSFTATTAYFASRIAFVATHVVFAVWGASMPLCACALGRMSHGCDSFVVIGRREAHDAEHC